MPYNPQVEDRSGQIRAQGYLEKVRGISMGAEGIAKQYAENKFRNQAIQGQNEALLKQFITDPEMEKYAPEGATKLIEKAQQGGGLSLADNIKLNGYLNTTLSTRKAIQEQQMEAQKKALMQQQVQMNQMQMAQAQRAQQIEMARQAQLAQLGRDRELVNRGPVAGFGTAVMDAQVRDPAVQRVAQADTNPYLRVAEQAQVAGVPIGAAMEYEVQMGRAKAPQKADIQTIPTKDENGNPISVTVDLTKRDPKSRTGFVEIASAPKETGPEVPDPLVNNIYSELAKDRNERVMPAISAIQSYDMAEKILAEGKDAVIVGATQLPEMFVKRMASALGKESKDVANTQVLAASLAAPVAQIIKQFGAGTGLSDADREYALRAAGGDMSMDYEAIKKIVRMGRVASENVRKKYLERLDKTFPENTKSEKYKIARQSLLIDGPSSPAQTTETWTPEKERELQKLEAELAASKTRK